MGFEPCRLLLYAYTELREVLLYRDVNNLEGTDYFFLLGRESFQIVSDLFRTLNDEKQFTHYSDYTIPVSYQHTDSLFLYFVLLSKTRGNLRIT